MEGHPANDISYFLSLPLAHRDYLGAIRHWDNLKIGFEEECVWVKDLTPAQADSVDVKTIPYKEIYYAEGHQLFPKGSRLPARTLPPLLWTAIERGLPVELPLPGPDPSGFAGKVPVRIIASQEEKEAFALWVPLDLLASYIKTAPAIRLRHLRWTIVNETGAFIVGAPVLPLQGATFWRRDSFLFPAGFEPALPVLNGPLHHLLNLHNDRWIIWTEKGGYWELPDKELQPLSIGSFRQTVNRHV